MVSIAVHSRTGTGPAAPLRRPCSDQPRAPHCATVGRSTRRGIRGPAPDAAPTDATTRERAPDEASTDATADEASTLSSNGCPAGMSRVTTFCVDTYEAYVVEVDDAGVESPHSPYATLGDGVVARARVAAGVVPQAYVSQVQAAAACAQAGKRLCAASEFTLACRGADAGDDYPYGGTTRVPGDCNEGQGSPLPAFFGSDSSSWTYADLNDPRLDDRDGGLVPSGSLPRCISPFGVADCVGNVIEWGADPPDSNGHARLRGGSMADSELNGRGCLEHRAQENPQEDGKTGRREAENIFQPSRLPAFLSLALRAARP